VAAAGVVVNAVTALLFWSGRNTDLNIRGAFLHMAADAGVSLDPAISLLIAAVVAAGTLGLLRRSVDLALDAVPEGVDLPGVRSFLGALPGVIAIHDLHVWAMSTTETALTVHLVKLDGDIDDDPLARVAQELHDQFSIEHSTIQVETGRATRPCRRSADDIV